jgi:hypothetical protein
MTTPPRPSAPHRRFRIGRFTSCSQREQRVRVPPTVVALHADCNAAEVRAEEATNLVRQQRQPK